MTVVLVVRHSHTEFTVTANCQPVYQYQIFYFRKQPLLAKAVYCANDRVNKFLVDHRWLGIWTRVARLAVQRSTYRVNQAVRDVILLIYKHRRRLRPAEFLFPLQNMILYSTYLILIANKERNHQCCLVNFPKIGYVKQSSRRIFFHIPSVFENEQIMPVQYTKKTALFFFSINHKICTDT